MDELKRRYEVEKVTFQEKNGYPPAIHELSEELQSDIKRLIEPAVIEQGMRALEIYLNAF